MYADQTTNIIPPQETQPRTQSLLDSVKEGPFKTPLHNYILMGISVFLAVCVPIAIALTVSLTAIPRFDKTYLFPADRSESHRGGTLKGFITGTYNTAYSGASSKDCLIPFSAFQDDPDGVLQRCATNENGIPKLMRFYILKDGVYYYHNQTGGSNATFNWDDDLLLEEIKYAVRKVRDDTQFSEKVMFFEAGFFGEYGLWTGPEMPSGAVLDKYVDFLQDFSLDFRDTIVAPISPLLKDPVPYGFTMYYLDQVPPPFSVSLSSTRTVIAGNMTLPTTDQEFTEFKYNVDTYHVMLIHGEDLPFTTLPYLDKIVDTVGIHIDINDVIIYKSHNRYYLKFYYSYSAPYILSTDLWVLQFKVFPKHGSELDVYSNLPSWSVPLGSIGYDTCEIEINWENYLDLIEGEDLLGYRLTPCTLHTSSCAVDYLFDHGHQQGGFFTRGF